MTVISPDWLTAPDAQGVARMLTDAGHQAWFVGGCVRNAIIGAGATDIDLSTDARPDRVMELAKAAGFKPVPTGIDHGTITVVAQGQAFEVTTFRRDVETDGRRAVVAFADTLAEDAHRRDFTMNALYADASGRVTDPVGGLPDLLARHLRFIDDPHQRIREDYLRILRFFRFSAWYADPDHGIDQEGLAACAELADGLEGLSKERVGHEMRKLLSAPDPAPATAAMANCGALWRILPGAGAHLLTVLVHVEEVAGLAPDPIRRLASLGGQDVADGLRLSRDEVRRLDLLTQAMGEETGAGELGYRHGTETALDILALRAALMGREIDPTRIAEARFGADQTLPISAADLMPDLSGAGLGDGLRRAESAWISSGFTQSAADLIRLAKNPG